MQWSGEARRSLGVTFPKGRNEIGARQRQAWAWIDIREGRLCLSVSIDPTAPRSSCPSTTHSLNMTPQIQRLSRARPIEEFINVLKRDGCVVISDFTSAETVIKANAEIRPYLDVQGQGSKVGGKWIIVALPS